MARKTDAALVQEYLEWMRDVRKRSPASVYSYRRTLILWLRHIQPTPLVAVAVTDVDTFLARPREVGGRLKGEVVAAGTLKGELARVRSLYDWMVRRDYAYGNPARKVDSPTVHNERPRPVPDADWKRLWFAALPDDERVAYGLGYFTGLRRHEICNLTPDQFIDVPRPIIVDVRRKGGKRQNINWASCVRFYATKRPDLIGDPLSFTGALERLLDARRGQARLLPWAERRYGALAKHVSRDTGVPAEHVLPDQLNKHLRRRLALLAEDPLAEILAPIDGECAIPPMGRWG
jgi:site-specific recombinase XerC